jgi:hypothetical protein
MVLWVSCNARSYMLCLINIRVLGKCRWSMCHYTVCFMIYSAAHILSCYSVTETLLRLSYVWSKKSVSYIRPMAFYKYWIRHSSAVSMNEASGS